MLICAILFWNLVFIFEFLKFIIVHVLSDEKICSGMKNSGITVVAYVIARAGLSLIISTLVKYRSPLYMYNYAEMLHVK